MNEEEQIELPNEAEPIEEDWEELPFKIGDVICKRNALKTPAKIVGIRRVDKHRVVLYLVTSRKRFVEWEGPTWWFEKPEARASYLYAISNNYKERADEIMERAEAARMVTP